MPRIFINPGHGGDDCGAAAFGLEESVIAMQIGKRVETYLNHIGYTTKVFQYDGLKGICNEANDWDADLFVSIHCNAFDGVAHGTETIYWEHSDASKNLAECIQNQIVSALGTLDRGITTKIGGGYDAFVTKYTAMPAVLVETAFIDNAADARLLVTRQDDFARAIARGITDYYSAPL